MKSFLILLVPFFLAAPSSINDVREAFQNAENSKEFAEEFHELIKKELHLNKNVKKAYLGASMTLLAKHDGSIQERVKMFNAGKEHIEKAVEEEPHNLEIRIVRLLIQYNAPAILGYRANIEMDKEFILENFSKASPDLKKYIQDIAKETKVFSPEEKALLK